MTVKSKSGNSQPAPTQPENAWQRLCSTVRPMVNDLRQVDRIHDSTPAGRYRTSLAAAVDNQASAWLGSSNDPFGNEFRYLREGFPKKILKQLRRGDYRIDDELDLHGMHLDPAQVAVNGFLDSAIEANYRCIRIVHGKGLRSPGRRSVIKAAIPEWLIRNNNVVAFCSAPQSDGGTGAVYVLLR